MSWELERSQERVQSHLDNIGEIEISKLVREANLDQLLTETRCRTIFGAHVYCDISNFNRLISSGKYQEDDYKRVIQGLHIYQREVGRIVECSDGFDGLRVHFQGSKLHALFYRPIDNAEMISARAVLLQLVLKDFVRSVFNPAFPYYEDLEVASGTDIGEVIGTRDGLHGDRELLFVGPAANHAAKIIGASGSLQLTSNIFDALPTDLQDMCSKVDDDRYKLNAVSSEKLDELLAANGIEWDRAACAERIADAKRKYPLKDINYSSAEALIDLDDLGIKNNKRVLGASIFADISGFTRYIDSAETEDEKQAALRVFHVIRRELAKVIRSDFGGLRIQYQGDRVQGLFHLPKDDEAAIATKAVETAIALQSSMEHVIKVILPETEPLTLAVGADMGITLVSKLGPHGNRDRICIGEPVERAALYEERSEGGQVGIAKQMYDLLPAHLADHFDYDRSAQCYIASGLTVETLQWAADSDIYNSTNRVSVSSGAAGIRITNREEPDARSVFPSRPYGP